MDILRAEKNAQDRMVNSEPLGGIKFESGMVLEWADPYFGMLQKSGMDGVVFVKDIVQMFGNEVEEVL